MNVDKQKLITAGQNYAKKLHFYYTIKQWLIDEL